MKKIDEAIELLHYLCSIGDVLIADKKHAMQEEIRSLLRKGSEYVYVIAKDLGVSNETVYFLIQTMGDVFTCEDAPSKVFLSENKP